MKTKFCKIIAIALTMCAATLFASGAQAQTVNFDLEDQSPTSLSSKDTGALTFLSITKSGFTVEISRLGSAFDVKDTSSIGPDYVYPAEWGRNALSSFCDSESSTPLVINFSAPVSSVSVMMGDFSQDVDELSLIAFAQADGQGEPLGEDRKVLSPTPDDEIFVSQKMTVTASGIRSITLLGGSPRWSHSMFYDNLTVDIGKHSSG